MRTKKRRVPGIVILLIVLLIPIIAAGITFYWIGTYYRDTERIYPNISIAGVDVSWLTPEEAIEALDLSQFEQRVGNAGITISFPDDSAFTIRAEDINLTNDALAAVNDIFSIGRGRGFIRDTISFIERYYGGILYYNITSIYDIEALNEHVEEFVEDFNNRYEKTKPLIFDDRIIITKGAGQKLIEAPALKDIAYIGLFDSFDAGHPIEIYYDLPETTTNTREIIFIHQILSVPAESAELDIETLSVSDSVVGKSFDPLNAVELLNKTKTGETATIYMEYTEPEVSREYLESLLFRDLIGECTTWVHGPADRVTNVRLSSEAISSMILKPGEEFSFNDTVGVRSTSKGYRPGGAFVNNETVTVIGGGICQTSSTLYSAIKDTQILVTDRKPHGQPIPYLPRGRDATVFWGKQDFKFVNNTEYPLRIDFELDNRNLTARVYGTIIDDFPTTAVPIPAG